MFELGRERNIAPADVKDWDCIGSFMLDKIPVVSAGLFEF